MNKFILYIWASLLPYHASKLFISKTPDADISFLHGGVISHLCSGVYVFMKGATICKKCNRPLSIRKSGYGCCNPCQAEYMRNLKGFKKRVTTTIEMINVGKPIDSLLTAIRFTKKEKHPSMNGYKQFALFKCACGIEKELFIHDVKNGSTLSCGCLAGKSRIKYPGNIKSIYDCWQNMMFRCYDPSNVGFKYYGGANPKVTVCDEWRSDYNSFLKWAKENGWEPGLQLDKDTKGTGKLYSPGNCVFIPRLENLFASGPLPRGTDGRFLKTGKYL